MGRYYVAVNQKLCKACGICIGLCPKKVFTADLLGKAHPSHMENCVRCQVCEMRCPDFCVEVGEKND
ncbi:MAG: 4Fe-4S dicluster domain-containing protein [Bacillota bacterium]